MRITDTTCTKQELREAIDSAGAILKAQSNGNVYISGDLPNITLRCVSSSGPMARKSASGRKTRGATWIAHRMFFDVLYALRPNVRAATALATYHGAAEYIRDHGKTAHKIVQAGGRKTCFGDL
jgi:hypothetical protein